MPDTLAACTGLGADDGTGATTADSAVAAPDPGRGHGRRGGLRGPLHRLGAATARHPVAVLVGWALATAALLLAGLPGLAGGQFHSDGRLPGAESQRALDELTAHVPALTRAATTVVVHARRGPLLPAYTSDIAALTAALDRLPGRDTASPVHLKVAADGTTGLLTVRYRQPSAALTAADTAVLSSVVARGRRHGLEAYATGGPAGDDGSTSSSTGPAEGIGFGTALLVLIVAFGSAVAAGLPLSVAVTGLGAGLGAVRLLAGATPIGPEAPELATMIGLGVGIDYALFIVTRFREARRGGRDVGEAAGFAVATAGRSVLVAGATVVAAISALAVAGVPAVAGLGYSAAIVVTLVVAASLTLLPALLGLAGRHVDRLAPFGWASGAVTVTRRATVTCCTALPRLIRRRAGAGVPPRPRAPLPVAAQAAAVVARRGAATVSGWARWARHVGRRPTRYLLASAALLTLLAVPAVWLRPALVDTTGAPDAAQLLIAAHFGAGSTGPVLVVAQLPPVAAGQAVAALRAAALADPGVRAAEGEQVTANLAVVDITPGSGPDTAATAALVDRLRRTLPAAGTGATVWVSGPTATGIDLARRVTSRLPLLIGVVLAISFVLLVVMFRSLVVPAKAVVMNVASIAAAYGVLVAHYQWGWLAVTRTCIPSYVPLMMFAITFGLSMDYEIFLLSRVREAHLAGQSARRAVVTGLAGSARVITAAALIMVSVFGSFMLSSVPVVRMMGLGLATAVAIDASLIRLVLVPATMSLLGEANWWLPPWLDRVLPRVRTAH